jgi:hypothetical protein
MTEIVAISRRYITMSANDEAAGSWPRHLWRSYIAGRFVFWIFYTCGPISHARSKIATERNGE